MTLPKSLENRIVDFVTKALKKLEKGDKATVELEWEGVLTKTAFEWLVKSAHLFDLQLRGRKATDKDSHIITFRRQQ